MCISQERIILGYRRGPNLRDLIVRVKLAPVNPTIPRDNVPCASPRTCRYCPVIDTSGHITSTTTGKKHITKTNVRCTTNNFIYCIECTHCKLQYVGQTKNSIKVRFHKHFDNITSGRSDHIIGQHFNSIGHHKILDVRIYVLEFMRTPPDMSPESLRARLKIESTWIHRLRTTSPLGLNIADTQSW